MKSKGLPCHFARQDVDPFFMNRLFDFLRVFFCRPTRNGWHYGCRTGASSYAVYNLSHQGTDCLVSGFRPTEVMKAVMPRQGS